MIRIINHDQILDKILGFIDSTFGTPAPEDVIFLEIGDVERYDQLHINKAICPTLGQLKKSARSWLPSMATEIVVYSDQARPDLAQMAAKILSDQGYGNIYLYLAGEEDWLASGLWTNSSRVPVDGFSEKVPQ